VPRSRLLTAADIARCPHRVALERGFDVGDLATGQPFPIEIERRIREGSTHREATLQRLTELHPEAVSTDDYHATEAAAEAGAPIILRARLADTGPERRLMAADVLVRTGEHDGRPTYAPILIKNNEVVEAASTRRLLQGTLEALQPEDAQWIGGVGARRNDPMLRNGLALDHAWRVLEAFGFADARHFAGVVDRNQKLWWFALNEPEWGRWQLSAYDEAHALRQHVLEGHDRWRRGEGPFPTEPFWHRACPDCPFAARCRSELSAHDDVSLVRFTSKPQQLLLKEHQVTTRAALAALDPVAAAAAKHAELGDNTHQPETHLGREIERLDELIYRARSAVADSPLRRVPADALSCPVADVEVDVDMESYHDRTYLWGAYVTAHRDVPGIEPGYRSFACWSELDVAAEAAIFAEFWDWFTALRASARSNGATFAAYCFWASAEDGAMDRAVAAAGVDSDIAAELGAFRQRQPREWFDLHEVIRGQLQTDGPLGLKSLAKAAGFAWRDDNPSGEASMSWYEEAITRNGESARRRLLEYNEDDCKATRALRDWLNGTARQLPSREDWPVRS
jgi:predicted RecB family nuclease